MHSNEIDVLVYFYIKKWISAEHLLLQDTVFDAANTIYINMEYRISEVCLGSFQKPLEILLQSQGKIHLIIFLNETHNKQWF